MRFIADFHLHSKYSRATSSRMNLSEMAKSAEIKGVEILGTGDFTHPFWFEELKRGLKEAEPGLFKLKDEKSNTRFILTSEISCVYFKGKKQRKIHFILFVPSFEIAEKINEKLSLYGNLSADGRPTLTLDPKEVLEMILSFSEDCLLVPAHAWTPWFGIFGSKTGFDSIEECFEEYSKYIFSIETGLSSDPPMNWRLSSLDKITLISCSDAHSPENIGREANCFDTDFNYFSIIKAIKEKDKKRFLFTIEFFPEEGKYHYDGHRNCNVRFHPKETKKRNGICPVCQKPLTIGVLSRIEQLADRPEGFVPKNAIPYKHLIPLREIIAEALEQAKETEAVKREYTKLILEFKNEINILLNVEKKDLEKITLPKVVEGIMRARKGKVIIEPGYDGVYGKIRIFEKKEKKEEEVAGQGMLF